MALSPLSMAANSEEPLQSRPTAATPARRLRCWARLAMVRMMSTRSCRLDAMRDTIEAAWVVKSVRVSRNENTATPAITIGTNEKRAFQAMTVAQLLEWLASYRLTTRPTSEVRIRSLTTGQPQR